MIKIPGYGVFKIIRTYAVQFVVAQFIARQLVV